MNIYLFIFLFVLVLSISLFFSAFSNQKLAKYYFDKPQSPLGKLLRKIFRKQKYLVIFANISMLVFLVLYILLLRFTYFFIRIYMKSNQANNMTLKENIFFLVVSFIFLVAVFIWHLTIQSVTKVTITRLLDELINNPDILSETTFTEHVSDFKIFIVEKIYSRMELYRNNANKGVILFIIASVTKKLFDLLFTGKYISSSIIYSFKAIIVIPYFTYVLLIAIVVILFSYIILIWVYSEAHIKSMCMDELYDIEKSIRIKK